MNVYILKQIRERGKSELELQKKNFGEYHIAFQAKTIINGKN